MKTMENKAQTTTGNGKKNQADTTEENAGKKTGSLTASMDGVEHTATDKKQKTLHDLLVDGLKDIYSAEKQLVAALPKMAKAAYSEDLENAFNKHLAETKKQVERLEKIFARLQVENKSDTSCAAMEGLVEECQKTIDEYEESPVRDSALIIGAQKIEHYEIASYGSLCELADVLGYDNVCDILDRTLEEEGKTDKDLTKIAQSINDEACELSEH